MPVPTDPPKTLLSDRRIDEIRPLKVVCIGAGISGIIASIKLPQTLQKLELVVYDKNEGLGGAWFENQYPGVGCDIPSHSYQLSFESNPSWTSFYVSGPEILEYWRRVAQKHDCLKYMKFGYKVIEAHWDENSAKWRTTIEEMETGRHFNDESDVLISAMGTLNDWYWPDIAGLHDFEGKLLHSAAWDPSYNYAKKRVAVIGAGSSGVQIVPTLQPHVAHLDHYVRGKTWISPECARTEIDLRDPKASNFNFTEEEKEKWRENPAEYLSYRKKIEAELQGLNHIVMRDGDVQKMVRPYLEQILRERLSKKPEILEHIMPSFSPFCKRITPGVGYLDALIAENVSVIPNRITKVTESGIVTDDGVERPVDAIVCATGYDTTWLKRFPIHGKKSITLAQNWKSRTSTYLSITTSAFPNFFMASGPNSYLGTGNLLIMLEHQISYMASCLSKMQKQNIRSMEPKASAVADFTDFCDHYFAKTVFSEECSSWYKSPPGGRVTALWPGSSLHAIRAFQDPRWEDFEYEYADGNSFGWIGNGWSEGDFGEPGSRTYYLDGGGMLDEPLKR